MSQTKHETSRDNIAHITSISTSQQHKSWSKATAAAAGHSRE